MAFSHRAREVADRSRDDSSRGTRPRFVTIAAASNSNSNNNNSNPALQPRRTALKTSSDMAPPRPSSAVGAIDREQKEGLVNIPFFFSYSPPHLSPPFRLFWPILGRGTQHCPNRWSHEANRSVLFALFFAHVTVYSAPSVPFSRCARATTCCP